MKSKQIGKDRNSDDAMAKLMEQYLDNQVERETGEHSFATVKSIDDSNDYVFIEAGEQTGLIDRTELLDRDGQITVNPGQKIDVFFYRSDSGETYYTTRPTDPITDAVLETARQEQIPLTGTIQKQIRGGYEIRLGDATAFCPDSQMSREDPSAGDEVPVIIRETGKRVVCSHRQYKQIIRELEKEKLQSALSPGDVVEGTVTQVKDFGAFVDLGGLEGLVPVSELSFKKVQHPSDVVSVGQRIRVKVMDLDWKEDRMTLSYRALLKNPWQGELPFSEGEIVDGKVENIKPFGVFVELTDGFSGLIPGAETGVPRGQSLDKSFEPGKSVRVMVTKIDRSSQRISLSITKVNEADARKDYEEYMQQSNSGSGEEISSFGKALLESLNQDKKKQKKNK